MTAVYQKKQPSQNNYNHFRFSYTYNSLDTSMSKEDKELQKMRQQVTTLFPEMAADILKMDKNDLVQIVQLSKTTQMSVANKQTKQGDSKKNSRDPKIQAMIEEILKYFPETAAQFDTLDDNDIQEIYAQVNLGKKKKQDQTGQDKNQKKDEINVVQMKNTLVARLPQFQNEIMNMPDDEIIKMYNDLQEEQLKSRKKKEIQKKAEAEEQKNPLLEIKTGGYSKKEVKQLKHKHKCKITLYLDAEDFNIDEKSEQGRKDGLKNIMDKLQKAFAAL